jgi:hypothetical protein
MQPVTIHCTWCHRPAREHSTWEAFWHLAFLWFTDRTPTYAVGSSEFSLEPIGADEMRNMLQGPCISICEEMSIEEARMRFPTTSAVQGREER